MMMQLETERLILRKFEYKDVEDLYEYAKDEEVTKYLKFATYKSIEDAQDRIDDLLAKYAQEEKYCWAIEEKESQKLIGSIDLFDVTSGEKEVGYLLNREYWNKGYATEAAKEVIKYGFEKLNLNKIWGHCVTVNIGSSKVMEKIGMKYQGITEREKEVRGITYDLKEYAITKEEYLKK